MKKNGFTLIELVVVIVILGILAVVAAPKFMNLQVDARNASLKGLEGSLNQLLVQPMPNSQLQGSKMKIMSQPVTAVEMVFSASI
ncbi:type IV pilin protein [Photobacterium leiognathi subsp. mandapamensis]|uniref:type IV pilin protein n=1 Tax=Photobacterium leiognathi TaxID=553611 RepID=UPI003BF4F4BE